MSLSTNGTRRTGLSTDDASSEDYEVIEYPVMIDSDSPAAAALRANAQIHVSTFGKAARAAHLQSVRKAIKRVKPRKRGKPPRVPPVLYPHEDVEDEEVSEGDEFESDDDEVSEDEEETIEGESASHTKNALDPLVIDPESDDDDEMVALKPMSAPPSPVKKAAPDLSPQDDSSRNDSIIPAGVAPGTVEAGRKVLGAVDPHDLLKQVRWRRSKKGHQQKEKSYVKGKVIDGEHELYTLSIAVMIGVRTSITRTNTELNANGKRFVNDKDFWATEKYEFRPKGDGPLPPHQLAHTFKFKDYSPVVFAYLRRMYGVNEFDFLLSVCGNANFIEFISNAKSGQFFFYSSDGRYMIKTMTNAESKFLRRILPQYFRHCCENPNTMMTRFFGMYRVKLYHLRRNVKFVIMNSVYYTDKYLQNFYDLKGSSVGRNARPGQAVLKDNDLRSKLPEQALALKPEQRARVQEQLERDVKFLSECGIMDYSMLVGIHHIPAFGNRANSQTLSFRKKNSRRPTVGGSVKTEEDLCAVVNRSPVRKKGKEMGGLEFSPARRAKHRRSEAIADGLDEDDNSYLEGSNNRPTSNEKSDAETEQKKQATIEKLYWPFHRLFDIHGHRRLAPATTRESECGEQLAAYHIPQFVAPLSDRKDKGFEMDVTGLQLPLKTDGPGGELLYEGKIFYMGVIDVLQEYTARKSLESRYRSMRTAMPLAASCVPPTDYGQRFLDFFREYTKRDLSESTHNNEEQGFEISEREA